MSIEYNSSNSSTWRSRKPTRYLCGFFLGLRIQLLVKELVKGVGFYEQKSFFFG
jgi:hypothetical protein